MVSFSSQSCCGSRMSREQRQWQLHDRLLVPLTAHSAAPHSSSSTAEGISCLHAQDAQPAVRANGIMLPPSFTGNICSLRRLVTSSQALHAAAANFALSVPHMLICELHTLPRHHLPLPARCCWQRAVGRHTPTWTPCACFWPTRPPWWPFCGTSSWQVSHISRMIAHPGMAPDMNVRFISCHSG